MENKMKTNTKELNTTAEQWIKEAKALLTKLKNKTGK